MFQLSTLVCAAALATSAVAMPTPAEPLFVSRMVRRQILHDSSAPVPSVATSTCGEYALQQPQKLQLRSYNDSASAYFSVSDTNSQYLLTALAPTSGSQDAYEFDFQTCNYTGFTQGFSRNRGGSMGAPIEFWGRVVTNVTTTTTAATAAAEQTSQQKCLSASSAQDTSGTFTLDSCNDADSKQWFRLQEGIGGAQLSYFPVQNHTGYQYNGQTPEFFQADLHPSSQDVNAVRYTQVDSYQYVLFD